MSKRCEKVGDVVERFLDGLADAAFFAALIIAIVSVALGSFGVLIGAPGLSSEDVWMVGVFGVIIAVFGFLVGATRIFDTGYKALKTERYVVLISGGIILILLGAVNDIGIGIRFSTRVPLFIIIGGLVAVIVGILDSAFNRQVS